MLFVVRGLKARREATRVSSALHHFNELEKNKERRSEADLVDPDWFPVELDLVHDSTSVLCILLRQKLAESEALVSLGDTIFGEMDVDCKRKREV